MREGFHSNSLYDKGVGRLEVKIAHVRVTLVVLQNNEVRAPKGKFCHRFQYVDHDSQNDTHIMTTGLAPHLPPDLTGVQKSDLERLWSAQNRQLVDVRPTSELSTKIVIDDITNRFILRLHGFLVRFLKKQLPQESPKETNTALQSRLHRQYVRPYQWDGISWLLHLYHCGLGGILAGKCNIQWVTNPVGY